MLEGVLTTLIIYFLPNMNSKASIIRTISAIFFIKVIKKFELSHVRTMGIFDE